MLCSGIVLCGGRGTRVGGEDKGLLDYRGRPLVQQVLAQIAPQLDDLVISANRNQQDYERLGYPVVSDRLEDYQGPLAGILACLPHCRHEQVVIVPCDMPALPADLVTRLLSALEGRDISYAWDGEREQYLVAAWHRSLAKSLDAYLQSGQRAVRHWYAGLDTGQADFSDTTHSFTNVNRL